MAHVKTERLPGESILITTFADQITVQDIQDSGPFTEALIREIGGTIYYILDVRESKSTFKGILDILRMPVDGGQAEAQASGIQVNLMMVGSDALAKLYVQAVQQQQYGSMQIPLFATLEAAIDAARTALALNTQVSQTRTDAQTAAD